jgi:hypothetical protein
MLEFASSFAPRRVVRIWDKLHPYLLRFGKEAADTFCRLKKARRHRRLLGRKQQQQVGNSQKQGMHV